ncbi:MAG: hypothetical protein QM757_06350 [Paludibaculum sp.]
MPTPVEFMRQYRNLRVNVGVDDPVTRVCRNQVYIAQLRKYFMMDWTAGTEESRDYAEVTRGSRDDAWFQANKERIRTAAMGKGSPQDYQLALEWAVRARKITTPNQTSIQTYCDDHSGHRLLGLCDQLSVCRGQAHVLRFGGAQHERRVVLQHRGGGE